MKGIFRKSAIGLAILGLASSAYAGTITGAFFGAEGVDLQPRNGDLDFVTAFPGEDPGTYLTSSIHPTYSWDFRIYGGFNFCGDEDITVSWLRYHTHDIDNYGTPFVGADEPTDSAVRFLEPGPWSDITATVDFKLDEVYGVYGHTAHFGPWAFRFAGGVEWARLDSDLGVTAYFTPVPGLQPEVDVASGFTAESDMHGVGPRVEFDMSYHFPYGLDAFGRTNIALLIAKRSVDLDALDPDVTLLDDYTFKNHHVVVPKLGIKLGLGYTYAFGMMGGEGASCDNTTLTVEAGWQVDTYIHAIERPEGFENDSLSTDSGTHANYATKVSNFSLQGFFIGAKLSTGWF